MEEQQRVQEFLQAWTAAEPDDMVVEEVYTPDGRKLELRVDDLFALLSR